MTTPLDLQQPERFIRREPFTGRLAYPEIIAGRVPLDVYPHAAPDPVRPSDFWGEGKPWGHAWAHRSMWLSTSISQWLSVDAWPAAGSRVAKYIRTNLVSTPLGMQHAFVERINIERQPSAPYGSTVELMGPPTIPIHELRGLRGRHG